jgi:hypothetical protein
MVGIELKQSKLQQLSVINYHLKKEMFEHYPTAEYDLNMGKRLKGIKKKLSSVTEEVRKLDIKV